MGYPLFSFAVLVLGPVLGGFVVNSPWIGFLNASSFKDLGKAKVQSPDLSSKE